jgi:hypothetical protein
LPRFDERRLPQDSPTVMVDLADQTLVTFLELRESACHVAARALLGNELLDRRAALRLDVLRREPIARVDRRLNAIGELEDLRERDCHA